MEIVLSIAGSDSSAGAGVQQDLKTMAAMGCYGATVVTAVTAQNTLGVGKVSAVSAEMVSAQLDAVLDDMPVAAIKIGMIPNREVAMIVVEALSHHPVAKDLPVVYDPVMVSTSGKRLMEETCMDYLSDALLPHCTLVTPNLPEAGVLLGMVDGAPDDKTLSARETGMMLARHYGAAFLVKGGHASGDIVEDWLCMPDGAAMSFGAPRVSSRNLHGTGCTLSSAIASALAKGIPLPTAVSSGKEIVSRAIAQGAALIMGHGSGATWPF